jgi:hypothetical protein
MDNSHKHYRFCREQSSLSSTQHSKLNKFIRTKLDDPDNSLFEKHLYINVIVHVFNKKKINNSSVSIDIPHVSSNDIEQMIKTLNDDFNGKNHPPHKYVKKTHKLNPHPKQVKEMLDTKGSLDCTFTLSQIIYSTLDLSSTPYSSISQIPEPTDFNILNTLIKSISSPSIDTVKNLNIWIVPELPEGLLGYAIFPWELFYDPENTPSIDGVVVDQITVTDKFKKTPFSQNKTATHEVGHWMGLYHTFQRWIHSPPFEHHFIDYDSTSSDCVNDIPFQNSPSYGNMYDKINAGGVWTHCFDPRKSKSRSWSMFFNFMDYSDDAALFMFTKDQMKKARFMLKIFRPDFFPK